MFWTDNSPELKVFLADGTVDVLGIIGQKSFRREKIFFFSDTITDGLAEPVLEKTSSGGGRCGSAVHWVFWRNFARIGTQFFKKKFPSLQW